MAIPQALPLTLPLPPPTPTPPAPPFVPVVTGDINLFLGLFEFKPEFTTEGDAGEGGRSFRITGEELAFVFELLADPPKRLGGDGWGCEVVFKFELGFGLYVPEEGLDGG